MPEDEPLEEPAEIEAPAAEERKPFWRNPIAIVIGCVIVAAILIGGGIAVFRPASSNTTACKLYEDAYNQMADAARAKNNGLGTTAEQVRAEMSLMPSRIQDAFDKAMGDVAIKIRSSNEMAAAYASDHSQDSGVAFFITTNSVRDACKADGAAIELHKMK